MDMSVMSRDRAENIKHRFTIYLHGENHAMKTSALKPAASQTFREGLEHSPGVEPTKEEPGNDTFSPESHVT